MKIEDFLTYVPEGFIYSYDDLSTMVCELQKRIDKAIVYIKEYCIDDEFYINLTNKEKCIFDVLQILQSKEGDEDGL